MKNKFFELSVFSSQNEILKNFAFELGVEAVEEVEGGFVVRDEDDLSALEFGLKELASRLNIDIRTCMQIKDNIDWIEKYKKSVQPIKVGKFYVRPSWEEKGEGLDIIVDPALAFGSGHHESTNSCLTLISSHVDSNLKTALDVGCGSGILSIALAKLGLKVDACDTDEQATDATAANAAKNDVKLNQIWTGSVNGAGDKTYDVVVANIIADIILMLAPDLVSKVAPGGYLVISGILDKYKSRVLDAFSNLKLVENISKNEWESFIFKK